MSDPTANDNDDVTDSRAGFFRIAPAWEMVFARTFGTRYVQINEGMTIEYYVWRGRMYIVDVTGSYDEAISDDKSNILNPCR